MPNGTHAPFELASRETSLQGLRFFTMKKNRRIIHTSLLIEALDLLKISVLVNVQKLHKMKTR